MKKEIKKLIDSGYTVEEIIAELKEHQGDQQVRCEFCNSRLADFENGIITIKCRCGEYTKII